MIEPLQKWGIFEGHCMGCQCYFSLVKLIFTGNKPYFCPECKAQIQLNIAVARE